MSNTNPPSTPYCGNCGTSVNPGAAACLQCGHVPTSGTAYCQRCGTSAGTGQAVCLSCGSALRGGTGGSGEKTKVAAGLLGILLGWSGAHKFYLGYNVPGILMLLATGAGFCLLFFFVGVFFVWIPGTVGLIEGILYLTKSDAEFHQTYVVNKREWF